MISYKFLHRIPLPTCKPYKLAHGTRPQLKVRLPIDDRPWLRINRRVEVHASSDGEQGAPRSKSTQLPSNQASGSSPLAPRTRRTALPSRKYQPPAKPSAGQLLQRRIRSCKTWQQLTSLLTEASPSLDVRSLVIALERALVLQSTVVDTHEEEGKVDGGRGTSSNATSPTGGAVDEDSRGPDTQASNSDEGSSSGSDTQSRYSDEGAYSGSDSEEEETDEEGRALVSEDDEGGFEYSGREPERPGASLQTLTQSGQGAEDKEGSDRPSSVSETFSSVAGATGAAAAAAAADSEEEAVASKEAVSHPAQSLFFQVATELIHRLAPTSSLVHLSYLLKMMSLLGMDKSGTRKGIMEQMLSAARSADMAAVSQALVSACLTLPSGELAEDTSTVSPPNASLSASAPDHATQPGLNLLLPDPEWLEAMANICLSRGFNLLNGEDLARLALSFARVAGPAGWRVPFGLTASLLDEARVQMLVMSPGEACVMLDAMQLLHQQASTDRRLQQHQETAIDRQLQQQQETSTGGIDRRQQNQQEASTDRRLQWLLAETEGKLRGGTMGSAGALQSLADIMIEASTLPSKALPPLSSPLDTEAATYLGVRAKQQPVVEVWSSSWRSLAMGAVLEVLNDTESDLQAEAVCSLVSATAQAQCQAPEEYIQALPKAVIATLEHMTSMQMIAVVRDLSLSNIQPSNELVGSIEGVLMDRLLAAASYSDGTVHSGLQGKDEAELGSGQGHLPLFLREVDELSASLADSSQTVIGSPADSLASRIHLELLNCTSPVTLVHLKALVTAASQVQLDYICSGGIPDRLPLLFSALASRYQEARKTSRRPKTAIVSPDQSRSDSELLKYSVSLEVLCMQSRHAFPQLSPDALASMLSDLGVMKKSPPESWCLGCFDEMALRMKDLSADGVADLMQGLAALRMRPSLSFLAQLMKHYSSQCLPQCNSLGSAVTVLTSLSRLQASAPPFWVQSVVTYMQHRERGQPSLLDRGAAPHVLLKLANAVMEFEVMLSKSWIDQFVHGCLLPCVVDASPSHVASLSMACVDLGLTPPAQIETIQLVDAPVDSDANQQLGQQAQSQVPGQAQELKASQGKDMIPGYSSPMGDLRRSARVQALFTDKDKTSGFLVGLTDEELASLCNTVSSAFVGASRSKLRFMPDSALVDMMASLLAMSTQPDHGWTNALFDAALSRLRPGNRYVGRPPLCASPPAQALLAVWCARVEDARADGVVGFGGEGEDKESKEGGTEGVVGETVLTLTVKALEGPSWWLEQRLRPFSVTQLCSLLTTLAELGCTPPRAWLDVVEQEVARKIDASASCQVVAALAEALLALGHKPHPDFWSCVCLATESRLEELQADQLTALIDMHAKHSPTAPPKEWADEALELVSLAQRGYLNRHLIVLIWSALATWRDSYIPSKITYESLLDATYYFMGGCDPAWLCAVLSSVSRVSARQRPPDFKWLDRTAFEASMQIDEYSSKQLLAVLLALTNLNHRPERDWQRLVLRKLRVHLKNMEYNLQHITYMLGALSQLRISPSSLWMETVLDATSKNWHSMPPALLVKLLSLLLQLEYKPSQEWSIGISEELTAGLLQTANAHQVAPTDLVGAMAFLENSGALPNPALESAVNDYLDSYGDQGTT